MQKKKHLFEMEIFCNSFDEFNASLLNKNIIIIKSNPQFLQKNEEVSLCSILTWCYTRLDIINTKQKVSLILTFVVTKWMNIPKKIILFLYFTDKNVQVWNGMMIST